MQANSESNDIGFVLPTYTLLVNLVSQVNYGLSVGFISFNLFSPIRFKWDRHLINDNDHDKAISQTEVLY